ncbi:MAG: transporter substrate-binding protein, partial [Acidimicrobiia bacterium]|nr:transporter substrate-binding protein [Acidimicrobiia bacterium]
MITLRRLRLWHALVLVLAMLAAACGSSSDSTDTTSGSESSTSEAASGSGTSEAGGTDSTEAAAPSGDPIKVGVLHSLSGTMSISEVAVHDAELLAIKEINANGGVLGRPIVPVVEDGASDWPTFASKAEKLLTVDKVAVVFGGWTSASRKAMLPVFEGLDGLLFYPVQYEGLEASPNIFYTGATTNQQIIPALDYIVEQGWKNVYLVGSDYVFPRTANKIIKAYAAKYGLNIV